MTLIPKLDLDMVKMYHDTKIEVSVSTHSKVTAQTHRHSHTHRHTHADMTKNITSTVYVGGNYKLFIFCTFPHAQCALRYALQ